MCKSQSMFKDWNTASYCICLYIYHILKINENATLVFSIAFQHGLANQNFIFIKQFYFTYSIKNLFFVFIDCQYALFTSICWKTSCLTPCNVPHQWKLFSIRALLADLVDNIFPTSKFLDMCSPYQNIPRLNLENIRTILELVAAVSWNVIFRPVYYCIFYFIWTKHWCKHKWRTAAQNSSINLASLSMTSRVMT